MERGEIQIPRDQDDPLFLARVAAENAKAAAQQDEGRRYVAALARINADRSRRNRPHLQPQAAEKLIHHGEL